MFPSWGCVRDWPARRARRPLRQATNPSRRPRASHSRGLLPANGSQREARTTQRDKVPGPDPARGWLGPPSSSPGGSRPGAHGMGVRPQTTCSSLGDQDVRFRRHSILRSGPWRSAEQMPPGKEGRGRVPAPPPRVLPPQPPVPADGALRVPQTQPHLRTDDGAFLPHGRISLCSAVGDNAQGPAAVHLST